MRVRWLALLLVACSAPAAPVKPAAPPVVELGPPAPVTCGDAGVILRGHVEDEHDAGPAKEAAIAQSCLQGAWSEAVLACVGGSTEPKACLDQLADAQRAAYRVKMTRWNDEFPDEVFADAPADDDPIAFVDCGRAIGDASQYAPVLDQRGEERELATAMRRQHLLALCEDWTNEARACFEGTTQPERCRVKLAPDQQQALADRLAEVDALMVKVTAARQPTCKKVVELHYADARWAGKLDALHPRDKKKLVAESRKRMLEACAVDKWSVAVRACIAVGGGEPCFVAGGMTAQTWGFPPSAIPIKTGIAECDAYADTLRALAACTQIPRAAAQAMLDAYQQTAPAMLNLTPALRATTGSSCKQADVAIRESARSLGCTI